MKRVRPKAKKKSSCPRGLDRLARRCPAAMFSYGHGRARAGVSRKENTQWNEPLGILLWRRPTLARPIAVLPSGLQRFTSVFGMGTGGATALLSPELNGEFLAAQFW
jgi:hypothetical protein